MKTSANATKSTRAKSHKPVKANNAIGVPATGSAPIVSQNVAIVVDTVPGPDSVNVSAVVVDINNQTEDQNMDTSTDNTNAPADNTTIEAQTSADTDTDKATIARLTADLAAARADMAAAHADLDEWKAKIYALPTPLDTLTALFKGDKSTHATALTALVKLAHGKDATGASFPEVTRSHVGEIVTIGIWRGIARAARGQYNTDSKAFAVGRDIAGKARKAAVKGSDKAEEAALSETRALLDLGSSLPDLIHGLRNQYAADRAADNAIKPFNGIDKGSASRKADKRFEKIEGEAAAD